MTTTSIFTPVQIGRAGEDIALQIEAAILEEKIPTGERLPSERELQAQFQCGRGVIREAIRALKQKGLVEIRKGAKGGAYIKHIEAANVGESLALFLKQKQIGPGYIAEFRESIDRVITILAIARADKVEKEALVTETSKLLQMLEGPEVDKETLARHDRELNIRLAKMSKNPIFEWVMEAIQLGYSSQDYALYDQPGYRRKTAENWHATACRIADNDPMKALNSIAAHYALLQRCIDEITEKPENDAESNETYA
ncbi:FadR/GntR family transcriptional regulator [Desulfofustis glycolicus]|uniref:DNA-binding transcriptional regulator, FadR family n=1 Tax=Desulfofustis glycolicus DSM 9705 TaxID=1121409 RepID=A0A1M5SLW3_9BACT|nr:GntR family transcriptional regulator [Desulfofustis glycolicus]MCB2215649.1 GntR family transcriptional regulator [Desulfobulbaceae bacterium]SHH39505.1 DNA-binding transcriptional regulator, FadR family [Desulfofustis glycolicus DSM 9705]